MLTNLKRNLPGGQRLKRNSVELGIKNEIDHVTSLLMQKKPGITNPDTSEEVDKLGSQLKVVLQTACRVSAAAESFGGMQIECRIKNSISGVIQHVSENLRYNFEKNKGKFDLCLRNVISESKFPISEMFNLFKICNPFQTYSLSPA